MRISLLVLATVLAGIPACAAKSVPRPVAASAACEKLGDTDRTVSNLFTSGDVYQAERAYRDVSIGRAGTEPRNVGAALYVHATPGMTGAYLQRTLECYTTASRTVHPNDPFHPATGSVQDVTVSSAGDSFMIRVEGNDRDAAEDIWNRAYALTSSTVTVEQVGNSRASAAPF